MNFKYKHKVESDADIDVTSFMNLMIVLVPVLLLSMTFTQTTVIEVKLPELTGGEFETDDPQSKLEVEISETGFRVFYPENTLIQNIPLLQASADTIAADVDATDENGELDAVPKTTRSYDYRQLSFVLQAIKQQVSEKRDILLRSELDIDYQYIIGTMDTLKSYRTVVVASVVEIELFPEISLDDSRTVVKTRLQ